MNSDSVIEVSELQKTYRKGTIKAVDGVSFKVGRGEILALIGPNGAGKTTVFGCLLGLIKPTAGDIIIDGGSPFDTDVKAKLGFLPERPCYDRWMTVYQFLRYQHMLAKMPVQNIDRDIRSMLEFVELSIDPHKRKVQELSRGMLQRVGLAQALIGRPQICFFDEPTAGMDPLGFILMRKLLLKCKNDGMTVVVNSHHLAEVERCCDRAAFIRGGKIEAIEPIEKLSRANTILSLRWNNASGEPNSLPEIVARLGANLVSSAPGEARVSTANQSTAAALIKEVVNSGYELFEAMFEKRELVDLFLNDPSKDQESTDKPPI